MENAVLYFSLCGFISHSSSSNVILKDLSFSPYMCFIMSFLRDAKDFELLNLPFSKEMFRMLFLRVKVLNLHASLSLFN